VKVKMSVGIVQTSYKVQQQLKCLLTFKYMHISSIIIVICDFSYSMIEDKVML